MSYTLEDFNKALNENSDYAEFKLFDESTLGNYQVKIYEDDNLRKKVLIFNTLDGNIIYQNFFEVDLLEDEDLLENSLSLYSPEGILPSFALYEDLEDHVIYILNYRDSTITKMQLSLANKKLNIDNLSSYLPFIGELKTQNVTLTQFREEYIYFACTRTCYIIDDDIKLDLKATELDDSLIPINQLHEDLTVTKAPSVIAVNKDNLSEVYSYSFLFRVDSDDSIYLNDYYSKISPSTILISIGDLSMGEEADRLFLLDAEKKKTVEMSYASLTKFNNEFFIFVDPRFDYDLEVVRLRDFKRVSLSSIWEYDPDDNFEEKGYNLF